MKCAFFMAVVSVQLLVLLILHRQNTETSALSNAWITMLPHDNVMIAGVARLLLGEFAVNPENVWVHSKGLTTHSDVNLAKLVKQLLKHIAGVPVQIGDCNCPEQERYYNLQMRVYMVDSGEAFAILVKLNTVKWIRSDNVRYLVLLVAEPPWREKQYMSEIFHIMFEMFMLNINIVVAARTNNKTLEMYTYYPYSAGNCRSTVPVLIYAQRKHDITVPMLTSLYLPKMRHMNGCPLSAMLFHRPPFILLQPDKEGFDAVSGTDGELLKQIGHRLNFTIKLIPSNSSVPNRVYPNGTMTGVYKSLADQQVNLTLGDFSYSPERLKIFTLSQTYYQSNIRILIKSPGSYSPLEVLFYPYQTSAWCLFIGGFVTRWLALKVCGRWLNRVLPASLRRLMFGMWILSLFEVRSAYEGSYFKFMHKRPFKPSPTTFRELRRLNYVILCGYTGTNFEYVVKSQGFRYQLSENESIEQQFSNLEGNYGILMKEEYWATYMNSHPEQRAGFHFLKEALIMDFHCIYFTRFSHLIEGLDELLNLYHDAGLTKKLVADFVLNPRGARLKPDRRGADVGEMLTLSHLKGVFQLLATLWVVSACSFIAELLALRFQRIRWLLDRL